MVKPDLRKLTRDGGSDPENLGSFGCCGGGECSLLIRKSVAIALIQFKKNCMHACSRSACFPALCTIGSVPIIRSIRVLQDPS